MFYDIPATLPGELDELESYIGKYGRGELDAASLKARRVPFGCYEQRKDGTYMVRIRTTGGALTPAQLQVIGSLSQQYGSEAIHITTRQEFQIHDVALENVVPVMRALCAAGLSTRGGGGNTVRNIMISPDAGVSNDEVFDPSPYAFALTSRLISEPDSWVLPRKFKITFSNSEKDTAYAQFNDLGLITKIQNGVLGFCMSRKCRMCEGRTRPLWCQLKLPRRQSPLRSSLWNFPPRSLTSGGVVIVNSSTSQACIPC